MYFRWKIFKVNQINIMRITGTIFCLLILQIGFSQSFFQKTFKGVYEAYGAALLQNADSSYIIVGDANVNGKAKDIFIAKLNPHGDTLWTKTYGGTGTEIASSVSGAADGGFIITGHTQGSFGGGSGTSTYLIRCNSNGDTLWTRIAGISNWNGKGNDVVESIDGGFAVASVYLNQIVLFKVKANGNHSWAYEYAGYGQTNILSKANSVVHTADKGYVVAGVTANFGSGASDIYVVKADSMGYLNNTLHAFGGNKDEEAYSIRKTNDGGFIIAGYTKSFGDSVYGDAFLLKINASIQTQWMKIFSRGYKDDVGYYAEQCNDGGYIFTGYITDQSGFQNLFLIKTDSNGNLVWKKTYGTATGGKGYMAKQTLDGGYAVIGTLESSTANPEMWFMKTDSVGNSLCLQNTVTSTFSPAAVQTQTKYISAFGAAFGPIEVPTATTQSYVNSTSTFCYVGLNEQFKNNDGVIIYPNPSSGQVIIKLEHEAEFVLHNAFGQKVYSINLNKNSNSIDLKGFAAGIYYYTVKQQDRDLSGKLILE
ncbi:MAG: T9SS type A sorting domain-containing protein [Bacteroidota bacterium]